MWKEYAINVCTKTTDNLAKYIDAQINQKPVCMQRAFRNKSVQQF